MADQCLLFFATANSENSTVETPAPTAGEGACSCGTGSSTTGLDDEVVIEEEVEYKTKFSLPADDIY